MGREIFFCDPSVEQKAVGEGRHRHSNTSDLFLVLLQHQCSNAGQFHSGSLRSSTWPDDITERAISDKQPSVCLGGVRFSDRSSCDLHLKNNTNQTKH